MATHSSVLAWRIPGMGEHGGQPSMGSHGVGQDWSNSAAAAARYLKISFISRHTWMITWLIRILDYQSYFGTAGSFFVLSVLWGCHSAVLCWVLRRLHRLWNPRIFGQPPGVSPPMCAASCLAKKPAGLFADIWVSFSVQLPSPEYLTHQCQLSYCPWVPVSVLSPLWLHFICHLYRGPHGENPGECGGYLMCFPFLKMQHSMLNNWKVVSYILPSFTVVCCRRVNLYQPVH